MTELLKIGEVAHLLGISPKTVRFYQRLGLLNEAARTEAGYRQFNAHDLLRLQHIRRLQALGMSLKQIKSLLGQPDQTRAAPLRPVLQSLLKEVNDQIVRLAERRERLQKLLAQDGLGLDELAGEEPPGLRAAREQLGPLAEEISPAVWEQEAKIYNVLDAYNWPGGYQAVQQQIGAYLAAHPDHFRALLKLEERFVELAGLAPDASEVEAAVEEFLAFYARYPEIGQLTGTEPATAQIGAVFTDLLTLTLTPAQQRFVRLLEQRLETWQPSAVNTS